MGLIEYYVLFALSTSITACYLWFWPLLQKAKSQNITNSFTENPKLSTVIYVIISTLVAPILILPLVSNTLAQKFELGLSKEILKQE